MNHWIKTLIQMFGYKNTCHFYMFQFAVVLSSALKKKKLDFDHILSKQLGSTFQQNDLSNIKRRTPRLFMQPIGADNAEPLLV